MSRMIVKLWAPHSIFVVSLMTVTVYIYYFLLILAIEPSTSANYLPSLSVKKNPSSSHASTSEHPNYSSKFDRHVSYPWAEDPMCQHFNVQLAELGSIPDKWPLTSFPGSGVTWTRQIIEGVTGIYTGSVYKLDPSPVQLPGNKSLTGTDNPHCYCTIIDKDHEATMTTVGIEDYFRLLYIEGYSEQVQLDYGYRGVILLRNPMDVVFTYRNWQFAGKVGKAPPEAFQGSDWDEIVDFVAYAWADHAIRWIEQVKIGTVIFYENLLGTNATKELERMLNVMDFQPRPVDPDRLQCALKHRNRTDHKRLNKSRILLKKTHRVKLLKSIHSVQQALRRRGWPEIPIHLYDFHSPEGGVL